MIRIAALLFVSMLTCAAPAAACGPATHCEVASGFYLIQPPKGWDGKSALPVAVYFHGYSMNASDMMQDEAALKVFSDLGVLVVAPQGIEGRWHLPVFDGPDRDEYKFVADVMADVQKRFPIDHSRMMATGFSLGASMVWYLACRADVRFTAYVPFAGSFWKPEPADCPKGPVNVLHIHGATDATMPLAGRRLRSGMAQGNVFTGLATLRKVDQCRAERRVEEKRTLPDGTAVVCQLDDACDSGARIEACFHPGDHYVIADWYKTAWAFVEATKGAPTH